MSYEERARHNRLMHNWNTVIAQATEADAELHALKEKLAAVERERDEAHATIRARSAAHSQVADENGRLGAQLSALRAELQRKDAALRKAEQALFDHVAIEGDQASFALRAVRAALQPKEPPCQTA